MPRFYVTSRHALIARDTSHLDEDAGVEGYTIVIDHVRAMFLIDAINFILVSGEFFHFILAPTHFRIFIRPRCRPLAEPLELLDIVDDANP